MGVSVNGGTLIAGWFIWKNHQWMRTGGSPIFWKPPNVDLSWWKSVWFAGSRFLEFLPCIPEALREVQATHCSKRPPLDSASDTVGWAKSKLRLEMWFARLSNGTSLLNCKFHGEVPALQELGTRRLESRATTWFLFFIWSISEDASMLTWNVTECMHFLWNSLESGRGLRDAEWWQCGRLVGWTAGAVGLTVVMIKIRNHENGYEKIWKYVWYCLIRVISFTDNV